MNKKIIGLATLTLLCSSLPSFAGVYVGAGAGYFRIDQQDFLDEDNDLNDEQGAWKVYGGFNIADIFGVEISHIEFGEVEDDLIQLEAQGQTLAATLGFPIGDSGSLYAKAGQLYWDADATIVDRVEASDDGDDSFVGIGARIGDDEGLGVRLEFEQFDVGSAELDMPSISLHGEF